jgi:hypothetical protein
LLQGSGRDLQVGAYVTGAVLGVRGSVVEAGGDRVLGEGRFGKMIRILL